MSFISTYQSRKSLFADKLITKGVSASGTDGLTTLINKIDQIATINNGIYLLGNKDIIQTSDTATVCAFATDSGKLIDDTITIYSADSFYSNPMTADVTEWLKLTGNHGFDVSSSGATLAYIDGSNTVYLNRKINLYTDTTIIEFDCKRGNGYNPKNAFNGWIGDTSTHFQHTYARLNLSSDSSSCEFCSESFTVPSGIDWSDWIHVRMEFESGVQKLYLNGSLVKTTTQTYDDTMTEYMLHLAVWSSSSFDFSVKNMSIFTNPGTVGSGSHGACVGTYTASGAGLKQFVAVCGSVVSVPCEVLDCEFYDSGTTGTPNTDWWIQNITYLSLASTSEGLQIKNTHTSSNYYIMANKPNTTPSGVGDVEWNDFACEFEVVNLDVNCEFQLRDENSNVVRLGLTPSTSIGHTYRIEYTNNVAKTYKDGVYVTQSTGASGDVAIRFQIPPITLLIKNFKVYPI